jgi:membrane-bound ClpP family serine protease
MNIKNTPLLIGTILLIVGLVGLVFNQLSVFWVWLLVILGIIVIAWTVVVSKKDKDLKNK